MNDIKRSTMQIAYTAGALVTGTNRGVTQGTAVPGPAQWNLNDQQIRLLKLGIERVEVVASAGAIFNWPPIEYSCAINLYLAGQKISIPYSNDNSLTPELFLHNQMPVIPLGYYTFVDQISFGAFIATFDPAITAVTFINVHFFALFMDATAGVQSGYLGDPGNVCG